MIPAILFVLAATRPFHLPLGSNVAASFPLMQRFGAITIDVYPHGFRAKSIWLRAFAINGSSTLTIENPISRMYDEMPIADIGRMVSALGGHPVDVGPPQRVEVSAGNVRKIAARRYRVVYGPNDFIDVWTTAAVGASPAFRACVDAFVRSVAPATAAVLRNVPDTPIYVELNIGKYRKIALLQPGTVIYSAAGESEALHVSSWMFPAPFSAIFK